LRSKTGTTLIAVVRGEETKIAPGAGYRLQAEDILILFGKPEKIERAKEILLSKSEMGGFNP
jgi:K+/H+ antiporter YhaU regulatory subunit KhtT